ncbi:MAG: glycosyltransferase family A protein [Planctomycetaceae bacterium]
MSRPGNLPIIQEYIDSRLLSFDVRWHCVADSQKVKYKSNGIRCEWGECDIQGVGGPQRNVALDRITEGWVWFLDDDNIPHPDFDRQMVRAIADHPDAAAFVFSQDTLNGKVNSTRHAAPENVRHGEIDLARVRRSP